MKAMYNQVNGAFERFGVDLTLPRLVIDLDEL